MKPKNIPTAPGAGAPATPAEAARSFGQRLLGLLTEQLEGTLSWRTEGGAVAEVTVPSTSLLVSEG